MTGDKLNEGNALISQISQLEVSIKNIKNCIKRTELEDDFPSDMLNFSIGNNSCSIRRDKTIRFLWQELHSAEEDLTNLKRDFDAL